MAVIHISEEEAMRDFGALMTRIREGAEVSIDDGSRPVAVLKPATQSMPRTIEESIAIGRAREKARGYKVAMDADFARDLEEIVANRKPANWPEWD